MLTVVSVAAVALVWNSVSSRSHDACSFWQGATHKTQLEPTRFGAVTLFALPGPERMPNAVYAAGDGSVWFGEWAVPGVGHLYPNGTLVEYSWRFPYEGQQIEVSSVCGARTYIWGITYWDGRVWAGDTTGNQLVGVDPQTGSTETIPLPESSSFPYALTTGPNDSLWFTEIFSSKLGTVDSQGVLSEFSLPLGNYSTPSAIVFANSTTGYYADTGMPGTQNGSVFAFDLRDHAFKPVTNEGFASLTGLAVSNGGVWIAQHIYSNLAFYNFTDGSLTRFPTPTVDYVPTTLPYFVKSNGSQVWFNEHYADKIGVISQPEGTLTEYSVSAQRPSALGDISDTETFDIAGDRVWFAQLSNNAVGFVDASYTPPFSLQLTGGRGERVVLHAGGQTTVGLNLTGHLSSPVSFEASDSETPYSTPRLLSITASSERVPSLAGTLAISVSISADPAIAPGRYYVLLTETDGHTYSSVYVPVDVLGN